MAQTKLTVELKIAWWLRPVLVPLFMAARLGFCPSDSLVDRIVRAAVRVEVVK